MPPLVTVIIAFHRPREALARRQVESLLAQRDVRLSVVAVADGAETRALPWLAPLFGSARVRWVHHETPRGARAAFAAGLAEALSHAEADSLFAYCDQDDVWHPGKLALSAARLAGTGAALVHCDARLVSAAGAVIAPSLFAYEQRLEPGDLLDALLINAVSGFTAVFTRRAAEISLDLLADARGDILHDFITAIAAVAAGGVVPLSEPLADYVQHRANAIGAVQVIPRTARSAYLKRIRKLWHVFPAVRARSKARAVELFLERRQAAVGLHRQGLLPAWLQVLFSVEGPPEDPVAVDTLWQTVATELEYRGKSRHAGTARALRRGFYHHYQPPSQG